MAAWSAKALLITAGAFLVGGSIWYARAATVPLIVAALISTQLLPLIEMATGRGMARWLAVALSMLLVVAAGIGLAWVFTDTLFGNLGAVGTDISEGADKVVTWLRDNDDWAKQHEQGIRDFLGSILPAAKDAAGRHREGHPRRALLHGADREQRAPRARVPALHRHQRRHDLGMDPGRFSTERRDRVARAAAAAWNAASGYIRGISLIALIDTTVITAGMLIVGTPHVGTLALLSFVTLFVPILGAWVSGTVIVLVTLLAGGTGGAIAMAVVILVAQQLDSMFVTPLVYQQTVNLHPIVTLTAVIVGSQLLGIVGRLPGRPDGGGGLGRVQDARDLRSSSFPGLA